MEAICRHIIEEHGYTVSDEDLTRGIIAADRYYEERYWTDDSFWASEEEASRLWVEMYGVLLSEIGIDGDHVKMGRALYDYFGHGARWRTYPDVVPTFRRLKEEGLKLGLISNWDARLSKLCFDMGLHSFLDAVVSSASVGLVKPDPRIFEAALGRLDARPERSIHIGDQYYADILGARGVGMLPVMIDRHGFVTRADCPLVPDLDGMLELMGL